ncbi:MAG: anthranilate synthase component I family protein, partial [Bacteroidales bacterium]|nr:anthranilate synthase component I family protein [Bacteroidales bacterium]
MKTIIRTLTKTLLADLQTPVGLYLKIRDLYPGSALLESSDYHGGENTYSFIGFLPMAHFQVDKEVITELYPDGSVLTQKVTSKESVPEAFNAYLHSFEV